MATSTHLQLALDPKSIAVIGASENPHKVGGRPIMYMRKYGYKGKIYPVNPARAEIQGHKAYAALPALPEIPDMAIIALAGDGAVDAVTSCAALGIKVAIVMASGFGEVDAPGKAVQRAMRDTARAAGMRLVGPNSQGLANFGTGAIANFSTIFHDLPCRPGPAGIICQSGGLSQLIYGLLHKRGIGVRHCHATGNEADITVGELATQVARDPEVRLLLLYLETIGDPWHLAEAAEIARARDLPIVAVKSGRTPGGQKAASSHTGAVANEDRVVDAFFRHHAIWRASDPHDLVNAAELYLKGWRPKGRRLIAVSNSGATCVMAADLAQEMHLPLLAINKATREQLEAALPSFAGINNPIDITGALLTDSSLFGKVMKTVGADIDADLIFTGIPIAGTGYDVERFARDTAAMLTASNKPLALAIPQEEVAAPFIKRGLPVFGSDRLAMQALHQLVAHSELMRLKRTAAKPSAKKIQLPQRKGRFLNEADSMALLAAHGIPVVAQRLCRSAAEARAALHELGGAVAVKACSAALPHKSDLGFVALDVRTERDVVTIFNSFKQKLAKMKLASDGVILAQMAKGRREMVLGARIDPIFGPVIMLGDGGKYVEALADVVILIPPLIPSEVLEALGRLRIAAILRGVRGEPALDIKAVAKLAIRLSRIIQEAQGQIASIDLNPVIVKTRGEGLVVVDALVERGESDRRIVRKS